MSKRALSPIGEVLQEETATSTWILLPMELVVDHIIHNDLQVYGKLLRVSKELREWMTRVGSQLYHELLKHNYPNEYCLIYQFLDSTQMKLVVGLQIPVYTIITVHFQNMLYFQTITQSNEFDPETGTLHDPSILVGTSRSRNILQNYTHGYNKYDCLFQDIELLKRARTDVAFAVRVSRLFALAYPFALPDGAFYMATHALMRSLLIEIVSVCKHTHPEWFTDFIGSPQAYNPLEIFLHTLVERIGAMDIRPIFDQYINMTAIEVVERFYRKKGNPTTLSPQEVMIQWQTLLVPHMPAEMIILKTDVSIYIEPTLRYIDTISPITYAEKLITYLTSNESNNTDNFLHQTGMRTIRDTTLHILSLIHMEKVGFEIHQQEHLITQRLLEIEKEVRSLMTLANTVRSTTCLRYNPGRTYMDGYSTKKHPFLVFHPILNRCLNKIFLREFQLS